MPTASELRGILARAQATGENPTSQRALEQAVEQAAVEIERLEAERDEAVNWTETVERHGTDGFDALADTWLAMEAIRRVNNAVTSVFSKYSNDEIMGRFKQHITNVMHQSFVEGCLVGVKAERVNSAAAEAQRDKLAEALRKIVSTYDRNWQHQREKLDDCVPLAREALADLEPKP